MYTANFDLETTNFIEPDAARGKKLNPRICLGLRPAGTDEPYDLMISSILEWQDQEWSNKDWITPDPLTYCGLAWSSQEAEDDQDWTHPVSKNLDHDSDDRIIKHSIERKFAGSSKSDYTFNLGTGYEIVIIQGTWRDQNFNSTTIGK